MDDKIIGAVGAVRSRDDVERLVERVRQDTLAACAKVAEEHGSLAVAWAIRNLS